MISGRKVLAALAWLAVLAAVLGTVGSTRAREQAPATKKRGESPKAVVPGMPTTWKEIDRLVSEQKLEQASKLLLELLRSAQKRKDEPEWTRALIREVQLRIALHGYETAVRFLKEEAWPEGLLHRTALELFYARSLGHYLQAYSWEIQQRERVEAAGGVDLKAWTAQQISAEAERAYQRLWDEREALAKEEVRSLFEFLDPNDYPSGIRGTLRDAVSYLFIAHLADSGGWSPAQSNEVFRLDVSALIRADATPPHSVKLDDASVHPLLKLTAILADLETWHARRGQREGALEARLERLRRLFASFTEEEDRQKIEKDLEERLPTVADLPWFSMGKAQLAEFIEQANRQGHLVRARATAKEGLKAYPDSVGGRRCLAIVKRIEAPQYQLRVMQSDGPGRRSILVAHKNVGNLYFRAYSVDLARRVEDARSPYSVLPRSDEMTRIIDGKPPVAQWKVSLPATPDFQTHATYVVPPMREPGLYVVAASGASPFGGPGFPLTAANFIVSDLVLVLRPIADQAGGSNALEIQALSGETGNALPGVDVTAYRAFWNPERIERIASATTNAKGLALFSAPGERGGGGHFVFARKAKDFALDLSVYWPSGTASSTLTTSSLLFTDRSIYRPLQKISWKVLGYRGNVREAQFEIFPATPVTVTLFDQNSQKVDARTVTTNDFGSAAGEFTIPAGRALGNWRLDSSLGRAQASFRVEEYKRPTFEVTWKDPSEPLRLNRPATLVGEARYYFGLPVPSGSVRWRVSRTPRFWWWSPWWETRNPAARTQTVAAGTSPLKPDGTFQISFTPAADERLGQDAKDLTYTYQVEADASDEGGETRSASRSFRLGFVSVEARVEQPQGFLLESRPGRFTVVRSSLDGVPRAGPGSWRIMRLEQPARGMLPADQAPRLPASGERFHTPGDAERPRWDTEYSPERMVRLWKDQGEVAHGDVTHNAKGEAAIEVADLRSGAYRLRYRTVDDFGAIFEMSREFFVAGQGTPLALPAVLLAESTSVPVGATARFLVTSGLPNQTLFFDLYSAGRRIDRRELHSERSPALIEIPVGEKDRGGFSVKLRTR